MTCLPMKPEACFDRVAWFALTFIMGSVVATLALFTWYKTNHIETRFNLEPQ